MYLYVNLANISDEATTFKTSGSHLKNLTYYGRKFAEN